MTDSPHSQPAGDTAGRRDSPEAALALAIDKTDESFPVLKAFQDFLDRERERARRRVFALTVCFLAALFAMAAVFVVVFAMFVSRTFHQNEELLIRKEEQQNRLIELLVSSPKATPPATAPQVPAQAPDSARQISPRPQPNVVPAPAPSAPTPPQPPAPDAGQARQPAQTTVVNEVPAQTTAQPPTPPKAAPPEGPAKPPTTPKAAPPEKSAKSPAPPKAAPPEKSAKSPAPPKAAPPEKSAPSPAPPKAAPPEKSAPSPAEPKAAPPPKAAAPKLVTLDIRQTRASRVPEGTAQDSIVVETPTGMRIPMRSLLPAPSTASK